MSNIQSSIPVLGFAAYSGTGKTTLLKSIIPLLKERGLRLGIIKHAHHNFDIDHPGKDSYELRKAGADKMLIASSQRWALMVEEPLYDDSPSLQTLINKLADDSIDLIIVEGFKHEAFPKIEINRAGLNKDLLYPNDDSIIALVTDRKFREDAPVKILDINNPNQIVTFICDKLLQQA